MTIDALTLLVSKTIGYTGNIVWDTSKPDGAPRKLMCSDKLRSTGWKPRLTIDKGLKATYEWYLSEVMLNDG
jgi:GDP-L-fucose synthase